LTNHRLSVLLKCWLGHLTLKIVSEMIYSVSSGMLEPYYSIPYQRALNLLLALQVTLATPKAKFDGQWC